MKQRSQAIKESLHAIFNHVEELREIEADLKALGVESFHFGEAIKVLDRSRFILAAVVHRTPNTAVGTPYECHNGSIASALTPEALHGPQRGPWDDPNEKGDI